MASTDPGMFDHFKVGCVDPIWAIDCPVFQSGIARLNALATNAIRAACLMFGIGINLRV